MKKNNFFINNRLENLIVYTFSVFPISFLIGNAVINLFLFLFSLFLILGIINKKFNIKDHDKITIYLLLGFFLSLVINLIFSNNFQLTYPRVLKFLLITGSILCFGQALLYLGQSEINKIFKIWSIIFIVVFLDIIFELLFKFNIFGNSSVIPGRIVSFSGDEMNIGHFFSAYCLIFLGYLNYKIKKPSLIFLISIILILVSFLIGERSNFIKTFCIISIFSFITLEIKFRYKIFTFCAILSFIILSINLNQNYKDRYYVQFAEVLSAKGLNHYLNTSIYGAHYKVAYEIFKDNPYFGVGVKNYRIESFNDKYENLNHNTPERRGNTHPHQLHFEFLSETGLVGYISFIIFMVFSIFISIKNYLKNKNFFQLSSILYISISLLPLLPSGSFFSTYSSGLFWLNYSIMICYNNKNIKF